MTRTIACLLLATASAIAQSTPAKLSFEAVSIKPGPPGSPMQLMQSGKIFFHVDDSTMNHEQKEIPVYALTVAKDGPKFKESSDEDKTDKGCNGGYRKVCGQVTMESFVTMLSRLSKANAPGAPDQPVIDATGLPGKYDFVFESGRQSGRGAGPVEGIDVVSYADGLEALGLKLEPTRHTYDILVVDHIERTPTEN